MTLLFWDHGLGRSLLPCRSRTRDREVLGSWLRSPSIRAGLALRARIVLLAADGVGTGQIAVQVRTSKQTVISWKSRYREEASAVWRTGPSRAVGR